MAFRRIRIGTGQYVFLLLSLCLTNQARANGILSDGIGGARSMAMGGADVAWSSDPLSSMALNPAGLGFLSRPELDFGGVGGFASGTFNKPGVSYGNLGNSGGVLPQGAFAMPIASTPVVLGISFVPESTDVANWHYQDPPGGLMGTTSYGYQQDRSEILALRSALGIGVQINPQWSLGASFGATYSKNQLATPYTFQNLSPGAPGNSMLDGAKTLLSLNTSGYGWNGMAGVIYRPNPNLQFGVSYESETHVTATGSASGDVGVQLGAPGPVPFQYDASVKTILPQEVRFGTSWKFLPQWRVVGQIDWIDWKDSFHNLPLSFSNGSNPAVNLDLGSSFGETVPLNWKNEFVYRTGIEFEPTENWALRMGYSYGASPVPSSTLTPMNAAIFENTFTCGFGYHWKQYSVDFAYQYDIPVTQNIGTSGLLSGDYSGSSIKVSAQTFALTGGIQF
jgi:long-chain fatty acid transport protein